MPRGRVCIYFFQSEAHSLPQDLMMLIFGRPVSCFIFRDKVSSHEAGSSLDQDKINEIITHEESVHVSFSGEVITCYAPLFMILYLNVRVIIQRIG